MSKKGKSQGRRVQYQEILRPEGKPLSLEVMTDSQKEARDLILRYLLSAVRELEAQKNRKKSESDLETWRTPPVDPHRVNRIFFLSGARGSGKTSIITSVMNTASGQWPEGAEEQKHGEEEGKPSEGGDTGKKEDTSKRSLSDRERGRYKSMPLSDEEHRLLQQVVWLEWIDMDPHPSSTYLIASILARIEELIDRLGKRTTQGMRHPLGDVRDRLIDKLRKLQTRAIVGWEGNTEARAGRVDPMIHATEVRDTEQKRIGLAREFNNLLSEVSNVLSPDQRPLLFVLPIDDFDLNPAQAVALLRIVRMMAVPHLYTLINGDIKMAEESLLLMLRGQFAGLQSALSEMPREIDASVGEITVNALRKLLPPSQRYIIKPPSVKEALVFRLANERATVKQPDLKKLLSRILVPLHGRLSEGSKSQENETRQEPYEHPAYLTIHDMLNTADPIDKRVRIYDGARMLRLHMRHLADLWLRMRRLEHELNENCRAMVNVIYRYCDTSIEPKIDKLEKIIDDPSSGTSKEFAVAQAFLDVEGATNFDFGKKNWEIKKKIQLLRKFRTPQVILVGLTKDGKPPEDAKKDDMIARHAIIGYVLDEFLAQMGQMVCIFFADVYRELVAEDPRLGYDERNNLLDAVHYDALNNKVELDRSRIKLASVLGGEFSIDFRNDAIQRLPLVVTMHSVMHIELSPMVKRTEKNGTQEPWTLSDTTKGAYCLLHDLLLLYEHGGILTDRTRDANMHKRAYALWEDKYEVPWFSDVWNTFWEFNRFANLWNKAVRVAAEAYLQSAEMNRKHLVWSVCYGWITAGLQVFSKQPSRSMPQKGWFPGIQPDDSEVEVFSAELLNSLDSYASNPSVRGNAWSACLWLIDRLAKELRERDRSNVDNSRTRMLRSWFITLFCLLTPECGFFHQNRSRLKSKEKYNNSKITNKDYLTQASKIIRESMWALTKETNADWRKTANFESTVKDDETTIAEIIALAGTIGTISKSIDKKRKGGWGSSSQKTEDVFKNPATATQWGAAAAIWEEEARAARQAAEQNVEKNSINLKHLKTKMSLLINAIPDKIEKYVIEYILRMLTTNRNDSTFRAIRETVAERRVARLSDSELLWSPLGLALLIPDSIREISNKEDYAWLTNSKYGLSRTHLINNATVSATECVSVLSESLSAASKSLAKMGMLMAGAGRRGDDTSEAINNAETAMVAAMVVEACGEAIDAQVDANDYILNENVSSKWHKIAKNKKELDESRAAIVMVATTAATMVRLASEIIICHFKNDDIFKSRCENVVFYSEIICKNRGKLAEQGKDDKSQYDFIKDNILRDVKTVYMSLKRLTQLEDETSAQKLHEIAFENFSKTLDEKINSRNLQIEQDSITWRVHKATEFARKGLRHNVWGKGRHSVQSQTEESRYQHAYELIATSRILLRVICDALAKVDFVYPKNGKCLLDIESEVESESRRDALLSRTLDGIVNRRFQMLSGDERKRLPPSVVKIMEHIGDEYSTPQTAAVGTAIQTGASGTPANGSEQVK